MQEQMMSCLLNPIDSQLLLAIQSHGRASAKDLMRLFPDIPQATLYRHLTKMLSAGVIEVAEEKRIRGATVRIYAPVPFLQAELRALSEQHSANLYLQLFIQFTSGLLKEFRAYAADPAADPLRDGTGFSLCPIRATRAEIEEACEKIREILEPLRHNPPAPGRALHTFATVVTPPKTV